MGTRNRGGSMRSLLLTISALAAALAVLAGAGVAAAAGDPPGPVRPPADTRVMHWPDLEIAPYVLHETPSTTSVVILNTGNAQSTAAVLTWSLTKETVN